jgi:hypothetical protein
MITLSILFILIGIKKIMPLTKHWRKMEALGKKFQVPKTFINAHWTTIEPLLKDKTVAFNYIKDNYFEKYRSEHPLLNNEDKNIYSIAQILNRSRAAVRKKWHLLQAYMHEILQNNSSAIHVGREIIAGLVKIESYPIAFNSPAQTNLFSDIEKIIDETDCSKNWLNRSSRSSKSEVMKTTDITKAQLLLKDSGFTVDQTGKLHKLELVQRPVPLNLDEIDWSNVFKTAQNYLNEFEVTPEPEKAWIFEAVLEAIYGRSVWVWMRSK